MLSRLSVAAGHETSLNTRGPAAFQHKMWVEITSTPHTGIQNYEPLRRTCQKGIANQGFLAMTSEGLLGGSGGLSKWVNNGDD